MNKAIILAAGEGTRMKSNISKVLHKVCNKPLLEYVVDACEEANIDESIVIVGEKNEKQVINLLQTRAKYIKQEIGKDIPYGTGYAVKLAEDFIMDEDVIFVLFGDGPLITGNTIDKLKLYHLENKNSATVVTAKLDNPKGYGRIIKDKNIFKEIVEHKDCTEEQLNIKEVNTGIAAFNGKDLKYALNKLDTNNSQGELYLTDVFKILREENLKISTFLLEDNNEMLGINDKIQLAIVEKIMRKRINESYMSDGVIIENPDTVMIEKGVKIGKDTIIEQNTKILGNTTIGENCLIGMNSRIENAKIGNEVQILSSYINDAIVDDLADVGPFARLRPKAHLKSKVHIGNFVEVKNAVVGEETKAGHLAYIGDADLGKRINVSCGVIFANYDGKNKFRSTIGDDSFLGSNVNIVSPINVANQGFLAAGSTITKDVEEGQLAIERGYQKNIDGYYEKKFGKKN